MRPDLDEFEEMNEAGSERSSRAMSWVVLSVAVIGFGALAYYAYQSGTQSVGDGQMLVVEADSSPIKEAPADPGGEQFPHKDKTIYDTLSPYRTDEQKVEKLLPDPEEPVIPEPAVGESEPAKTEATSSYVNNESANKTSTEVEPAPVKPVPASEEAAAAPVAETPKAEVKPAPVEVAEVPVATKTTTVPEKKPEPVKVEAPKAEPVKAPAPKPVAEKKPAPAPVKTAPAATGDFKVQLGAFKSEAEARTTWSKLTAKHGDVIKGSPIIVKADVNGTTFYRLRASGFASADAAKKACTTLSGRGQACFFAGK